jgi:hypothetical protein
MPAAMAPPSSTARCAGLRGERPDDALQRPRRALPALHALEAVERLARDHGRVAELPGEVAVVDRRLGEIAVRLGRAGLGHGGDRGAHRVAVGLGVELALLAEPDQDDPLAGEVRHLVQHPHAARLAVHVPLAQELAQRAARGAVECLGRGAELARLHHADDDAGAHELLRRAGLCAKFDRQLQRLR